MKTTRRSAIFGTIAAAGAGAAGQTLSGCSPSEAPANGALTKVTVLGVLHGRHRRTRSYSLDVLRKAVERAKPDVILTEIPPDRIDQARRSFAKTGKVDEPRTEVFPEYTDVVFPLSREMEFTLVGTAGWTQEIARNRAVALREIESDPARTAQWAAHEDARAEYARALDGRGTDPRFIHTREYDVLVQTMRTPYQIYFDPDLGPGGWTKINAAHTDLINAALDTIGGQGLNALVMFGSWHKYMIERSLSFRGDIDLIDPVPLFD